MFSIFIPIITKGHSVFSIFIPSLTKVIKEKVSPSGSSFVTAFVSCAWGRGYGWVGGWMEVEPTQ